MGQRRSLLGCDPRHPDLVRGSWGERWVPREHHVLDSSKTSKKQGSSGSRRTPSEPRATGNHESLCRELDSSIPDGWVAGRHSVNQAESRIRGELAVAEGHFHHGVVGCLPRVALHALCRERCSSSIGYSLHCRFWTDARGLGYSAPVCRGRCQMNLRAIGCNVDSAPVEIREKLAFDNAKLTRALAELTARYGADAVVLGTCNRVELYLARNET